MRKWSAKDLDAKDQRHTSAPSRPNDEPNEVVLVMYLSWVCNGLALGDAQSGRTVMIRTPRCSILCLQKAKVNSCLVAVKIVSIAARSTVRARTYDELASGRVCLNRIL